MFFVENGDLDEHPASPHKSFSFINDKNIIIKGQGRMKCFHLEEILLCRAVCKGPSTPSVAALAFFYYLQLYACKEKFPPLLHLFLCYSR